MSRRLSCEKHVERARSHREVGEALHAATGNEWAAVCYFYAAYHVVKAALLTDSIFDDLTALRSVSPDLLTTDRDASAHQMRRGSSSDFGVNDLVRLLYPDISSAYLELHGQSIAVRYMHGTSVPLDDLREDLDEIEAEFRTTTETRLNGVKAALAI